MKEIDCLLHARWIVPVEPAGLILEHASIAVDRGRIAAVGPRAELEAAFQPREAVTLDGHALLPGLVNSHTHAAMSLLRGLADDLPLSRWLNEHIWPTESRWVSSNFVQDGAELAIAEMLLGGTTCFADMYFFPEITARAAAAAGVRASIGMIVIDFPSAWGDGPHDYLVKGLALRDEYRGHPLVSFMFAPHSSYAVSDKWLRQIRTYADELDVPVQMHVHETADEVARHREQFGKRPLASLDDIGLLGPGFMAVHATQLLPEECERLAELGVHVIHCPESNMKLASGFCPVATLLAAGVNVALGTDGAASNNDLDLLGELRTAALVAKAVAADASAVPAAQALQMATLNGARALGLDADIGSLVAGKWADIVAVRLNDVHTLPIYNAISQLVYAAQRSDVTDVWVGGRRLVNAGRLTTLDRQRLLDRALGWQQRILDGQADARASQRTETE